jgi:MoaA/NifB/PqqE/SkfB family radical SAM enzyme
MDNQNSIETIQDLINLTHLLAVKNRKENGIYNVLLASLTGVLQIELNRINEFLSEENLIGLDSWKLISKQTIDTELDNLHPSINLAELLNVNEINPKKN